jgi:modulator of FtsH protease
MSNAPFRGRSPFTNDSSLGGASAPRIAYGASALALPFLRRVYLYLTAGIGFAIVGALVALYAGTPVAIDTGGEAGLAVPPVVAFELEHGILAMVLFFGAFFGAQFALKRPGLNVAGLFGFTFVTGLFLAPAIFIATAGASAHATLDPSPVRDAFLLTGITFVGLTGYCFTTRRDFSFLGASLSTGLWVVIGASVLGLFLHSTVFGLAIASVSVLVFAGFILYQTSMILRAGGGDAVSAALSLFLSVINLFMALLRILSSGRRS